MVGDLENALTKEVEKLILLIYFCDIFHHPIFESVNTQIQTYLHWVISHIFWVLFFMTRMQLQFSYTP